MRVIGFLLATLALTTVCADKNFSIVDNGGVSDGIGFNISGIIVTKPQLNVTFGETITFRIEQYLQSSLNNRVIPFGLTTSASASPQDFTSPALGSLTPSNSCILSTDVANSWYVNQTTGIPCIITWKVVAPDSGNYFWYTSRNPTYAGVIEVQGAPTQGSGATTPPPSGNTTSPPTGTTTSVPTTTAPTTPSPKSGAAIIVPGAAAALIIATIHAIVA